MKINLKLRFKNKTVLMALIAAFATFVYQVLGILGITPSISEETIVEWVGILLNLLVGLGILVDPTTAGLDDSETVMGYTEPRAKEGE